MLNIKPERKKEGTVFSVGRLRRGSEVSPLPYTNTVHIENESYMSRVLTTLAREHIKAQEYEVIILGSTIACYKC